jgi:hypothetical protein
VNVQGLRVSHHAQERFQQHHPDASSWDEIKTHVRYGQPIEGEVVAAALCWKQARAGSLYVLSPDRQGIFVIADNADGSRVLVTYLRLGLRHQEWAKNGWPTSYEG